MKKSKDDRNLNEKNPAGTNPAHNTPGDQGGGNVGGNICAFELVGERDIQAYIDGQLDARRAEKVEQYLERHPHIAEDVRSHLEYNAMIRNAYGHMHGVGDAIPPRLLATLNRPVRSLAPAMMKIAAVLVLCALSAGGGWIGAYQNKGAEKRDDRISRFLEQIAVNAEPSGGESAETLHINANLQADPMNWLTQKLALEMQAPDLTQAGYTLERRRLVIRGSQEFVQLRYRDAEGETIRLYMKTRWDKEPPAVKFSKLNEKSVAYWQEGPLVYALTGYLGQKDAALLADLVRSAMNKLPDTPQTVQPGVQIVTATSELSGSQDAYDADYSSDYDTKAAYDGEPALGGPTMTAQPINAVEPY